jgi:hypothetical protein
MSRLKIREQERTKCYHKIVFCSVEIYKMIIIDIFYYAILAIFAVAVIGQLMIILLVPLAIIIAIADYIKRLRNK